jgi:hypothetical protein
MILVMHDPSATDYAYGYRAIQGHKPVRIPSLYYVTDLKTTPSSGAMGDPIQSDEDVHEADMTSFTIRFSASGQMDIGPVRIRNRDGKALAKDKDESNDRVFNTATRIAGEGYVQPVFLLDDEEENQGRYEEISRDRFYIVERSRLEEAQRMGHPWEAYLQQVEATPIYLSPYNGQLIEAQP